MGQMMYITDYMATVVYQGDPSAKHGSKEGILFDDGVRMGSLGMLLHSVVGKKTKGILSAYHFLNAFILETQTIISTA